MQAVDQAMQAHDQWPMADYVGRSAQACGPNLGPKIGGLMTGHPKPQESFLPQILLFIYLFLDEL